MLLVLILTVYHYIYSRRFRRRKDEVSAGKEETGHVKIEPTVRPVIELPQEHEPPPASPAVQEQVPGTEPDVLSKQDSKPLLPSPEDPDEKAQAVTEDPQENTEQNENK